MIMFDYSHISSRIFEKIAKEYLQDKYPDYQWKITPASGDGNKDVFCQFKVLEQEYEYWAEVKFTKSFAPHTLLKGQLDPTLVSALLSAKPVSLCFISNNKMTEQYLYRLKDFKIKTNIGIELVLKDEFEHWLLDHPAILNKYNIKAILSNNLSSKIDTTIIAATITDIFNIGHYKIETHLIEKTIYYLYLIINGEDEVKNVSLKISDSFVLPESSKLYENPNDIYIKPGKHVYKFEIIPLQKGNTDLNIQLQKGNNILANYTIPNLVVTLNLNRELSYAEQEKTQCEIINLIKEADNHNILVPIIGSGSVGKSKLVQNIFTDLNTSTNIFTVSFVENEYLDMKNIIRILIFFNIGNVFECDKDSIISQMGIIADREKKIYYMSLIEGFFESPGTCINYLKSKIDSDDFCLLYPSYARVRQILILEDVHKVSKKLENILYKFLTEFLKYENNQFIIMTSREYYKNFVITKNFISLNQDWIAPYYLHGLSREDKLTTLNYYLSFNGNIKFNRTTDDLIVFSNILNTVIDEQNEKDLICRNAYLVDSFENPQFVNTFLYKERLNQFKKYHGLIECVFYINFGIEYLDLSRYFQEQDIEFLIEKRIIKRIGESIYPFHDHYVKAYFEEHKISDETVKILKEMSSLKKNDDKTYLYLSLLVESGYSEYTQVYDEAHELEYHYFKITDYYKSYTLSKAFKKYMNFDEVLSLQEISDLFIFSVSSGYFIEPKEVRKNYDLVIRYCRMLPLTPLVFGLILRTQSEMINIDYWELNIEQIDERLDKILKVPFKITSNDSDDLVCAYLNLWNRKMVIELLYEHYDKALEYFEINMKYIEKLHREEYKGYLYMDYAKGLYNCNLEKALSYMQKAQNIFKSIGTEYRRLLDCTCEIEYLKCIQSSNYDIRNLEYASERLNTSGFIELYAKSRFKLAAIKMVRGDYSNEDIEKELVLAKYVLKYDFTGRLLLFYKMLKNAFSVYSHLENQTLDLTSAEQKILYMMGIDYQKIWKHNSCSFKTKIVFFSKDSLFNEYVIDRRIW